jgi:hypothetical protein
MGLRRAVGVLAACAWQAALACSETQAKPGIGDPPAASTRVRHALNRHQLKALAGKRLQDAGASRLLAAPLQRVLGAGYAPFRASLAEEKPLRLEGQGAGLGLVGEGMVPDTLAYRGAFFIFGSRGAVFAAIKCGRHGTTIERYGSLDVLKDPALLHAYQEFAGIDE